MNYAALTIQCGIRCGKAWRATGERRIARDRELAARVLQRVLRGMFGRIKTRKARLER